nr:ubiquitin-protein ligase [uncultured bacterium]
MKITSLLCLFILYVSVASSQVTDSISNVQKQTLKGTPGHNMYGDLLKDDPSYNHRYPWYLVSGRILLTNAVNWAAAKYIYKVDWTSSGAKDWKNAFTKGPEWDSDGFGINFIGHPHTGNYYYNVARSNGYSFWQSFPFVLQGSLVWEYFGENTRPSYNDMINTPVSGMFLGEVIYRISSNILDDRTRGTERVFREILAGVVNPPRFFNRLTQGKLSRVTSQEVYQKEPLNITINAGATRINDGNKFGTGKTSAIANLQFDYGNPFEDISRKPYDLFRLRIEGSYGSDKKLLENVNGYGILTGTNYNHGKLLIGIFQHFDYWNNPLFEVGAIGFGGGLIGRAELAKHSNLYSTVHLAFVPLAGNNTRYGPDTSSFRHYNYGGGFQAKVEETINLNDWASIGLTGFFYWIHTYDGLPGNSLVGIFKPFATFRIYKNISLGVEHFIYNNDRYQHGEENLHLTRTEQKIFLQIFLENKDRKGKYH